MPAPSHTQDTIAHLRHCVRIESATGSYQVLRAPMLTATGGIVEVVSQGSISDDYEGTTFWIFPATSDEAPAGTHCIATTLCKRGDSDAVYHELRWNGSAIDFDLSDDPSEATNSLWYIIPNGDYFAIQSAQNGLFWTVVSGNVELSAWTGADTQLWKMMAQYSPAGGVFNVSPSLDVSQSVMSLTSSDMGAASIGASSQRTAHTVLSAEFIEQLTQSNAGHAQMDLAFPVNRAETRWNRLEFLDEETKRGQFEQRGPLSLGASDTRTCSLLPSENMVAILPSLVGRFTGQRLRYNTSSYDFSLSSYDGENRLGAFPTWQTSSADPTDGTQAWMMLPQNFFDSSLPTPMDLGCELIVSGQAYELADTQTLPVPDDTTSMTLRPRFDCSGSDYVVTAKLRFLTDGVWSDVVTVLEPESANVGACSSAPYAKLTGGPAWIPNAWPSSDSSRSITQDIEIPHTLFSDHQDASACQVILSVSSMRYGTAEGAPPVPFEGRTVSRTFTIGRHVSVSLGDSTLDQDGIHLDISVSGTTSYDLSIAKLIFVNGANDPESILQPEGVTGSDIAFSDLTSITHALMIGDPASAQLVVTGFVDSQFGTLPFSGVTTLSSSLTQAFQPSTWSAWGGMVYDRFSSLGDFSTYAGFQIVESEQGRRHVPISKIYTPASGIPYVARCGSYLGEDETTDPECAVIIWNVDGARYQYEIITSPRRPNLAAALYRRVPDIAGTPVHEHIEIIPLRGNLSGSMSVKNDVAAARRIGGRRYVAGSLRGQEPSLKFTGTIYSDATDTVTPAPRNNDPFIITTDIQTLMSIDASETLLLRTTWGTEHLVRIAGVDAPRDIAGAANLTIDLIEVES